MHNHNFINIFIEQGGKLLYLDDPKTAHKEFGIWTGNVASWINDIGNNSGLQENWQSLGDSDLWIDGICVGSYTSWTYFRQVVRKRLNWLINLPAEIKARQTVLSKIKDSKPYIEPARIQELKSLTAVNYDLTKLIRLCDELNNSFAEECYFATAMLARAILDHVPPLFGFKNFVEVANSRSKSTKASLLNLSNSLRNIADSHLHLQIRRSESLPTARQVDFATDMDVLLSEVCRVLKKP